MGAVDRFEGDRFERVRAAIAQLGPADHVRTLYDRREREAAIATSYIRTGLDRGELCVWVVDDGKDSILDALASEGVDIDEEMRRGRLTLLQNPLAQGLQTQDMLGKIEQYPGSLWRSGLPKSLLRSSRALPLAGLAAARSRMDDEETSSSFSWRRRATARWRAAWSSCRSRSGAASRAS